MRPVTDLQRKVAPFEAVTDMVPSGDQPQAIADLERRIRHNVQQSLAAPLTLQEYADAAGVSRAHLSRCFIRIAGRQSGISLPGRAGKRKLGRQDYASRYPPKMAEIGLYLSEPPSLSNYSLDWPIPVSCARELPNLGKPSKCDFGTPHTSCDLW